MRDGDREPSDWRQAVHNVSPGRVATLEALISRRVSVCTAYARLVRPRQAGDLTGGMGPHALPSPLFQ
jgi:hypothetical protein